MAKCIRCGAQVGFTQSECRACIEAAEAKLERIFAEREKAPMWRCVKCGKENQSNREHCWRCGTKEDGTAPENPENFELPNDRSMSPSPDAESLTEGVRKRSAQQLEATESKEASSLIVRYKNAYIYARFIVGVGDFMKGVGITLAVLFFLVLFATANVIKTNPLISLFTGIIVGGSVGVFFYIWGILISAVGEILKASLDGAVNGSPFLNDKQRAQIMAL